MYTHDLLTRHGKQSKRIVIAKIIFGGVRQLRNILDTLYISGFQTCLLHLFSVVLDIVIHSVDLFYESCTLKSHLLIKAHALLCLIPDHFSFSS